MKDIFKKASIVLIISLAFAFYCSLYVTPPPTKVRGVAQVFIPNIKSPWGVAVSKSGEVVVSQNDDHCISVYNKEGIIWI